MTEDALAAFQAADRPHRLPAEAYHRIEQAMLDACEDVGETAVAQSARGSTIDLVETPSLQPKPGGRATWIAVAAGLLIAALVSVQLIRTDDTSDPAAPTVLGDYCDDHLDPLADRLDLLRVNSTDTNATEAASLLGLALNQLDETPGMLLNVDDLADRYDRLPTGAAAANELIEISSVLGQRIASLSPSSPRCDLDRLAPNQNRSTDPLGRPTSDD